MSARTAAGLLCVVLVLLVILWHLGGTATSPACREAPFPTTTTATSVSASPVAPPTATAPESPGSAPIPTTQTPSNTGTTQASVNVANVGICVVGGLRTLWLTRQSQIENFYNALQPNRARRTMFYEVFDNPDDCHGNPMACPHCPHWCRENSKQSRQLVDELKLEAAEFRLNEDITCTHPELSNNTLCAHYPNAHQRFTFPFRKEGGVWSFSQYMSRYLCLKRLKDYEATTGVAFDLVALIRPDVAMLEPVPPADFILRMRPRVLFAPKEILNEPSDYLYVFPRSFLDGVTKIVWDAYDRTVERKWEPVHPEGRIFGLLKEWRFPYQIFPFLYTVVRRDKVAECGRMDHPTLQHTFVNSTDDGKIRSVVDDCKLKFPDPER